MERIEVVNALAACAFLEMACKALDAAALRFGYANLGAIALYVTAVSADMAAKCERTLDELERV